MGRASCRSSLGPRCRRLFGRPCSSPPLLKSLHATLWRQSPVIYGERLKHTVDAEGRHHFELVLEANEVEDDRPKPIARAGPGLTTSGFGKKASEGE
jgi:hypothetical protein